MSNIDFLSKILINDTIYDEKSYQLEKTQNNYFTLSTYVIN